MVSGFSLESDSESDGAEIIFIIECDGELGCSIFMLECDGELDRCIFMLESHLAMAALLLKFLSILEVER